MSAVEPISLQGFDQIHTGGGCMALQRRVEGLWIVLTGDQSDWDLGVYPHVEDEDWLGAEENLFYTDFSECPGVPVNQVVCVVESIVRARSHAPEELRDAIKAAVSELRSQFGR